MKAYKLKSAFGGYIEKDRIIVELDREVLLVATPTLKQSFISRNILTYKNDLEEINLLDETKIHHHLYKPLKIKVQELLTKL